MIEEMPETSKLTEVQRMKDYANKLLFYAIMDLMHASSDDDDDDEDDIVLTEFEVWALISGDTKFLHGPNCDCDQHEEGPFETAAEVRQMSEDAGGWYSYPPGERHLEFVSRNDWLDMYKNWKQRRTTKEVSKLKLPRRTKTKTN